MTLLSCQEMRDLEARAFAAGATPESLMEEAGRSIARAVQQFVPSPGICLVHFGKGHNGGDALVAARFLAQAGWRAFFFPAYDRAHWSPLTAKKFAELENCGGNPGGNFGGNAGGNLGGNAGGNRPVVVLDGLLGIGAGGKLRSPIVEATRQINAMEAVVFALDLPTGVDGDSGEADPDAVRADFTLSVGAVKKGMVADGATRYVGRLCVLPLPELEVAGAHLPLRESVATAGVLAPLMPRRGFDVHKGDFGRVAVVAGSRGFTGAALMASLACVRAGAGLITLYVTPEIYPIVAAAASPEVMVKPVESYLELLTFHHDAVAIGPGLGFAAAADVLALIERVEAPMIIDADAFTLLASHPDLLDCCAGPRLLTPHSGEMSRLDPSHGSRLHTVENFTRRYSHTLLLKGARTLVGQSGRPLSYNSTGTPGMATGGMGDVLTGVCAALAAQRLDLYDCARLASWLCGRAAELAISSGGDSQESLSPLSVLAHLGNAFTQLRSRCF